MERWQIDRYCAWAAVGVSEGTVRQRRHYLTQLARLHDGPLSITPDDLVAYITNPRWGQESRRSARATVVGYFRWASRNGIVPTDPAADLPSVRAKAGTPRPTPRDVMRDALARADGRERVMLLLGAYAGLRCGEIARLRGEDIQDGAIRVHGKGGKIRSVPIHPAILPELEGLPDGWVFPGRNGPMKPDSVSRRMSRLLGPHWTAHTLRHAFATRALAATGDLRSVQILLGHASPTTTARYTAVADERLAEVVRSIA